MISVHQLTSNGRLLLCEIQSRKNVGNRTQQNRFSENIGHETLREIHFWHIALGRVVP
jgi:hypothetical protein